MTIRPSTLLFHDSKTLSTRRRFLGKSASVLSWSSLASVGVRAADNAPKEAVILPELISEPSEYYHIVSEIGGNLCLSAVEATVKNEMQLNVQSMANLPHQQWKISYLGAKKFAFAPRHMPDKRLDLSEYKAVNGQRIHLYHKHDELNQQWYFFSHDNGCVSIRSLLDVKFGCDVYNDVLPNGQTRPGNVCLHEIGGVANQKWKIQRVQ
jgi:hypothetical protein